MKNVSLKTIATRMNVSINTVSHALRDMDDISEPLKIRIRKAAIDMGYMPNHIAQTMKKDERPVVGIYLCEFTNLYFDIFNDEIVRVFRSRNEYNFVFLPSERFDMEVIKQCILQRVDLILTSEECDEATAAFAQLNAVRIVFVGSMVHPQENIDIVTIDNELGCRLAARYLYNYHNDSKYIYVGIGNEYCRIRRDYFADELRKLGEDADVKYFDIRTEDIQKLHKLIQNGYRSIFFFNDMTAYEALHKLDSLVVNVRKLYPNLHLVGFDGLCEWIYGIRQITTVKIDFASFAQTVYDVIAARLESPTGAPQQITLPVMLHQRWGEG